VCNHHSSDMPLSDGPLNSLNDGPSHSKFIDDTENSVLLEPQLIRPPLSAIPDNIPSLQCDVDASSHDSKLPPCDTESATESLVIDDSDASFASVSVADTKISSSTVSQVPSDTAPGTKLCGYSENVVPAASAGCESFVNSVSEVPAELSVTEVGPTPPDNQMTEMLVAIKSVDMEDGTKMSDKLPVIQSDGVEDGTKMSGELPVITVTSSVPSAAVTSRDHEADTQSPSPGHYVRKPAPAVVGAGNLKTSPKSDRRAFYLTNAVHNVVCIQGTCVTCPNLEALT